MIIEDQDDWRYPILQFLKNGDLPSDPKEARKIRRWAPRYVLIGNDEVYRRSYTWPLLKCLGPGEGQYVIDEIHSGICGSHIGAKTTAKKILRTGYYWPTMVVDIEATIRKCTSCQLHGNKSHLPPVKYQPINASVPFDIWGIDILGPFAKGVGGVKFLIVAVEYFTRWVEAEPMAIISSQKVQSYVWRNIICRFGVPRAIISDNGRQFIGNPFKTFCENLQIDQRLTSVAYPQANGLAEVTNRTILEGLKRRLTELEREGRRNDWPNEIPSILWAYRTTPRRATGETPFNLCFGVEAIMPVEVGQRSLRLAEYDPISNEEERRAELDLIEETRDKAARADQTYKRQVTNFFNKRVKERRFAVGELVLRRSDVGKQGQLTKLQEGWEGPYLVQKAYKGGSYQLADLEGRQILRPWNTCHLKKFYV